MTATAKPYPKSKLRTYRLRTYDVWGNARDGWEVNDTFDTGTVVAVRCKLVVCNPGTPHEFPTWHPTDRQLSLAVGVRGVEWESNGDDTPHYAERKRDGKPVCELEPVDAE